MRHGKSITTGLILEPAHRQGELEAIEEGKREEERTSEQKQLGLRDKMIPIIISISFSSVEIQQTCNKHRSKMQIK